MLLILTSEADFAADFLIVELLERSLPYFRLNTEDLGQRAEYLFELSEADKVRSITLGPRTVNLNDVNAVWYRRAIHPHAAKHLSLAERQFVVGELRHLARGLTIDPRVLWVNPIENVSIAEHKLYQLQIARQEGLRIPRTLVSADLSKVRDFTAGNQWGTICKPIFHGLFVDGPSRFSVYTRRVSPDDFDEDGLKALPVLLQEEIPRVADVRATFIGRHCFVADIKGDEGLIDWRDPSNVVHYARSQLSSDLERKCRAVLNKLGLVYGAFDFIRTSNGELVFLEVNPTGEWAWLEEQLGFPMRKAFVELMFGRYV